ncbi:MAG: F0F1 ATP synthase subunit delta [Methylovirgula sp.]
MHIDWSTLALQTVNVLILVWILARFLFRPVREIIAQRQAKTDAVLAEAAAARKQAAEAQAAVERARADIEAQREQLLATAQSEAAKEKARLLDAAAKEVADLRLEAESAAVRERAAMEEALIARIKDLAVEIARRLAGRISPEAGLDAFVAGLCAQFNKLPPQTRAAFTSETGHEEAIEIVTAAPLSAETGARVRQALEQIFGIGRQFTFDADPALIAGIEVHGRTASLRNSLREDLDRIVRELSSADEHTR